MCCLCWCLQWCCAASFPPAICPTRMRAGMATRCSRFARPTAATVFRRRWQPSGPTWTPIRKSLAPWRRVALSVSSANSPWIFLKPATWPSRRFPSFPGPSWRPGIPRYRCTGLAGPRWARGLLPSSSGNSGRASARRAAPHQHCFCDLAVFGKGSTLRPGAWRQYRMAPHARHVVAPLPLLSHRLSRIAFPPQPAAGGAVRGRRALNQ